MKIGINSFSYRWAIGYRDFKPRRPLTAFAVLAKASALGVDLVQIDDNLAWETMDTASLQLLAREARQRGIELQLGSFGMQPQHLTHMLELAHLADVHVLRINEDRKHWQPTVADLISAVSAVLSLCRTYDVTLAIENHFWYGADDVARLIAAVNDPHVAASLDTGNTVGRLEGWNEAVQALTPYAISLHLKDLATERRGVGFYVCGRPLGKGIMDLPLIVDTVRAAGRLQDIVVELWMDFAGDEETTLKQENEWLHESVSYVRHLLSVARRD